MTGKKPDYRSIPSGLVGWKQTGKDGQEQIYVVPDSVFDTGLKPFTLVLKGDASDNSTRDTKPNI